MATWIKICGLNDARSVAAATAAGVNALGFVFSESVRRVTPAHARSLLENLNTDVVRVAVMRHPSRAEWQAVLDDFQPDALQTDALDFDYLEVPDSVRRLPVYRDTQLHESQSLPDVDWLLYEGAASGSGELSDWPLARRIAAARRTVLAGGLSPENVANALATVKPWGVDVSSGVESAPGKKDCARIAAFVAAVRTHEEMNECS